MLPLFPARRAVYRWTCWIVGRHHSSAPGTLLSLLRSRLPVHLALRHLRQCLTNAFPGGWQYRGSVQSLCRAVPIHLQRTEELISITSDG